MFHSLQFTAQAWQPTQMSRSMTRPSFLPGRGDGRLVMSVVVSFRVLFLPPDLVAAAGRHAGHRLRDLLAVADVFEMTSGLGVLRLAGAQSAELLAEAQECRPVDRKSTRL